MNRRQFIASSGAAAAAVTSGAVAPKAASAAPTKRALMTLGYQAECTDAGLKAALRWGIKNIYARPPIADPDRLYATLDELKQMRDAADRNGVKIEILRPTNNLAMTNIDVEKHPAIMLGQSPQRDRDIEQMQTMIKNCAAVEIPGMRYTLSIVGNLRTGYVPGRGDSKYRSFKLSDAKPNPPLTRAGRVTEDMYWERITYFLERMVPVAEEYKVRLACHPEDGMTPPEGYQGVNEVVNTIEGAKKFLSIKESPYHGFLFCVGTFSEMLQNPAKDIYDVIRYFGSRKKIFVVDFRNIKGNRQEFVETFPDDGDVNMVEVMRVFKEVGYDGMICPDHTPETPAGSEAVLAFQYGYVRALIQAVDLMD